MFRVSVAEVLFPTLTTWGWPIRKSWMLLQRKVFILRLPSFVMSSEGDYGVER